MEGKNLSTYDVARRSGNLITHQTVWSLLNAQGKDVKVGTLKALAKGLGVQEDEIFAVARGITPVDNPDYKNWKFASLFDDAQQLTPEQMREFEILMEIARREVQRMIQEQEKNPPRKPRRPPVIPKVVNETQAKEKKRA
ncbi:MAG TPA: helix-turn-helix transcriptional regulator [Pyrinomonadaceae bacterium]|nr:helix-turn-helix transcriptional regulator [Pyrinomonadaceae bacterium]